MAPDTASAAANTNTNATATTLAGLLSSTSKRITPAPPSPSTPIADSISTVHAFLSKWDPHTSLSGSFLSAASHLHSYLLHLSSSSSSSGNSSAHRELVRTNSLLQSAMRRLDHEFKTHLLSLADSNSADRISAARAIAETMLATGYGEECLTTYQSVRRSAVSSQLKHLGFNISSSHRRKRMLKFITNGGSFDDRMKSWTDAAARAVCRVFYGERQLSDSIFGTSPENVRDAVFASVVSDIAVSFFSFPQTVSAATKRMPERLFSLLDMHEKISLLMPDIEVLFGSEPAAKVLARVSSSHTILADAARAALYEFEKAIRKAKPNTAPGGGILSLTRYVMNYLIRLFDYESSLYTILSSMPQEITNNNNINNSCFDVSDQDWYGSPVSVRIAWLLFVLLQKLESVAESYRDVALSYLFLVNNLQYIVKKVKSSNLMEVLGPDWATAQATRAQRYVEGHVRSAWSHVAAALPVKEQEHTEMVREFETLFLKIMKERENWVIVDVKTREEVRQLVESMLVPPYRGWYRVYRRNTEVRYTPEFVRSRVLRLYEDPDSPSGTLSSAASSGSGSGSGNSANKMLCRFGCYMPHEGDVSSRYHTEFDEARNGRELVIQYDSRGDGDDDGEQQGEVSLRLQIQDVDCNAKEQIMESEI